MNKDEIAKVAAAIKAVRAIVGAGHLPALKDELEALVEKLRSGIGPNPETGAHYTDEEIHAIAEVGRANFDEAIARSQVPAE